MNTAELRNKGWDAKENAEWADAAYFYTKALEVYPADQKGALADADKAKLAELAGQCRQRALEAGNRQREARSAKNAADLKPWLEALDIKPVPAPENSPTYARTWAADGLGLILTFNTATQAVDIEFRSAWGTHVECGTWRVPLNNPIQVLKDLIMSYVSYAQELL